MKLMRKNIKTRISFSKKELKTVVSKPIIHLLKWKKQKSSLKRKSHNVGINITKWNDLQEDTKSCKNCLRKEIENEINMVSCCDRYDSIRRKAFYDINEVDSIKLQMGSKIEKLKLLLVKGSLKVLYIFVQFLMKTFESRQQQPVEIRIN